MTSCTCCKMTGVKFKDWDAKSIPLEIVLTPREAVQNYTLFKLHFKCHCSK